MTLQSALLRLARDGPEQQAVDAGEIDAIIDYSTSNVILFPAAKRALSQSAREGAAAGRKAAAESHGNGLLSGLPYPERRRVLAGLAPVILKPGRMLHEPGVPIGWVYFPIDCAVSILAVLAGGETLEVGVVGHEGMVGLALVLGVEVSQVRVLVRAGGTALQMNADRFRETLEECPGLRRRLNRYAHDKLAAARTTIACNCFHTIEARLARSLLMTADSVRREEFFLTQVLLAQMLGVRRATVNEAAAPLRRRKLISYSRGRIRIVDRRALEAASCRCYAPVRG